MTLADGIDRNWLLLGLFALVLLGVLADGYFLAQRAKRPDFDPWSEI